MKKNTEILRDDKSLGGDDKVFPIRQFSENVSNEDESTKTKIRRIKSCDYAQWDKFDPGLCSIMTNYIYFSEIKIFVFRSGNAENGHKR